MAVTESTPILQGIGQVAEPSQKGTRLQVLGVVSLIASLFIVLAVIKLPGVSEVGTKSATFRSSVTADIVPENFVVTSAKTGYAPVPNNVLEMYSIDIILEPYVQNAISFTSTTSGQFKSEWRIRDVSSSSDEKPSVEIVDGYSNGTSINVIVSPVNTEFEITITVTPSIGDSFNVTRIAKTKFVRRELRSLTESDRERYFEAVEKIFSLTMEEGQALYGERFSSHAAFAGLHDSNLYLYHDNLFFVTSHPAMQLRYEQSLFAIDHKTPFPYWDFLEDSTLGANWTSAQVYHKDWFGPVTSSNEVPYLQGRFEGAQRIFDPAYSAYPEASHTIYGFLGLPMSPNKESLVTRSNKICGFEITQGFATCDHLQRCFDRFLRTDNDLKSFDMCLEMMVHANLHTMHAGMWDCTENWNVFYENEKSWLNPEFFSMIGMVQSSILALDFYKWGWVSCPDTCDANTDTKATCSCDSNVANVAQPSDVELLNPLVAHNMTRNMYEQLYKYGYGGKRYIEINSEGEYYPIGLTEEQVFKLDILCIKTSLWIGSYGDMASGAAANDPLFWVMHQLFDKALHGLRLSPYYNFDGFVWNQDDDGEGRGWNSTTPFKVSDFEPGIGNKAIGLENEASLTNQDLWSLLKPDAEWSNYVYDQLTNWGDCRFDPMEDPHMN